MDDNGSLVHDRDKIKEIAEDLYQNLLGTSSHSFTDVKAARVSQLINKRFSVSIVAGMQADVTKEEIRNTFFSMKRDKAPGPDGFSAGFFHKAWPIVGDDVTNAILELFFIPGGFLRRLIPRSLPLSLKRRIILLWGSIDRFLVAMLFINALPRSWPIG
jgi:hypothetical protein